MTPDKIQAVQNSFDRVFPIKEDFAKTFYTHLFEIAPQARPMFPDDMTEQRLKLTDTLSYTVRHLERPEVVEEAVQGLARRHIRYGALPEHFAPVGTALIYALQHHTPGGLSDLEAEGWLEAYMWISDQMLAEFARHTPQQQATGS